ncbi:MAG: energy-coupling factor transporter transmembrane component T [Clostridia bacterium]|nr:energy-coupling factor transporter transmembrane component T [Clostridia bacterium]
MIKDITLGQYYPADSAIHRLDPRAKLILFIEFIVATFIVDSLWMFIPLYVFVVFTLLMARIPLVFMLRSLKPVRWILIFMFVINLFLISTGDILVSFWSVTITTGGVRQACFVMLRLIVLVSGTSMLTFTTTPIALTDAIESLLSPLKLIGISPHVFAMIMTIALRFIPTLLDEADKIIKAQTSRGAQLDTGSIIQRIKAMVPILVPLIVGAFKRANELAMAMESRCYHGGEGRTKLRRLRFGWNDLLAEAVMVVLIAGIAVSQGVWL